MSAQVAITQYGCEILERALLRADPKFTWPRAGLYCQQQPLKESAVLIGGAAMAGMQPLTEGAVLGASSVLRIEVSAPLARLSLLCVPLSRVILIL